MAGDETTNGDLHPSAARVAESLRSAGVAGEVREFLQPTRTAAEAAAALGCPEGAIGSCLVVMADEEPVVVIRSGVARMDLDALATTLAARAVRRATASEVRTATGQPIGGVSPVGWPGPLRVYVDQALRAFDVVWSAAGTPNAVFATTFQELLAITGGEAITVVSEVSR